MVHVVLQQGHVARTKGATGTTGEQPYTRRVCEEAARRLRLLGHRADVIGADDPIRRSDVFCSVHADGSTSETARGASWGDRGDRASIEAGERWMTHYALLGMQRFRPRNYTQALAGYYGTTRARAAGTPVAWIVEGGFMTNPDERAWLTSDAGVKANAQAITTAALGRDAAIPEEDDMVTEAQMNEIVRRVWGFPVAGAAASDRLAAIDTRATHLEDALPGLPARVWGHEFAEIGGRADQWVHGGRHHITLIDDFLVDLRAELTAGFRSIAPTADGVAVDATDITLDDLLARIRTAVAEEVAQLRITTEPS